jgi:hypothetical protein
MPRLRLLDSIPEDSMKAATLLKRYKTFCVLCTRRIPRKRQRRRSITCGTEHQKMLTAMRKAERDHRQCSHCGRPSTPDERGQFRAWRTTKAVDHHRKNRKAAKGIRGAATATPKMEDFAYVVMETPKSRGKRSAHGGHAA